MDTPTTETATPLLDTAEPAQAAPATPEPVAEKEPGAFGREVMVMEYEQKPPEPAEPVADETVAEVPKPKEPIPEVPPEPAKELTHPTLRKANGNFDEDKIAEIAQAAQNGKDSWSRFDALVAKNPELELAVIKAMKADGMQLAPEQEAKLAVPPKPAEAPKPSTDLKALAASLATKHEAEYRARLAQYGEVDAKHFWMTAVEQPYMEAVMDSKNAAIKAEEASKAEKAAQTQRQQKAAETVRTQVAEVAKAYPSILKLDPKLPYGGDFIDKAVSDEVTKLRANLGGALSLMEITDIALFRLGRIKPVVPAAKPRVQTPPAMTPQVPRKAAPAPAPAGSWQRQVTVKG